MVTKIFPFRARLFLLSLVMTMTPTGSLYAASSTDDENKLPTSATGSTQQTGIDVRGKWSGAFFSKHSNVAPFTMTVVINPDSRGHLIGSSSMNSECLKDAHLEVTVKGSKIVLAGSNKEGDNITMRGTIDNTGILLTLTYILNGSATGSCETDDGTGTLGKR
jgi:hypothetical protein